VIDQRGGRIRIAALAQRLGCGERRLLRVFRRHVGLAPKAYASVVRFHVAAGDLAQGDSQVRVATRRGYADQAHLLRDFRRFAGVRPGAVGFVQSVPGAPE
jgi:transcriptional regulator GlxA family with amidase domain